MVLSKKLDNLWQVLAVQNFKMEEYNYQAEYAKSGRAGCKGCSTNIPQGALRLATLVQVIYIFKYLNIILLMYKLIKIFKIHFKL